MSRFAAIVDPKILHAKRVMWFQYGGKSCSVCGHEYTDADDMLNRNIVRSNSPPASLELACKDCFYPVENQPDGETDKGAPQ